MTVGGYLPVLAALSLGVVTTAFAQTTSYRYDALGRLVSSETRKIGTGGETEYAYDAASNRATLKSTGSFFAEWLEVNAQLLSGEAMLSFDGHYKLHLQRDGDLVLLNAENVAVWSLGTQGSGADRLVMQSDGNLVLYANTRAVWATMTFVPGTKFTVQIGGNLVLYGPNGPVWDRFSCC